QYSGESDSGTGSSNNWSIQLNTNTFTGSNSQDDWVQFTYQQPVNVLGQNELCIWQIELTTTTLEVAQV
ncbi:MAG: hypothetical protein ABSE82_11110, partial [Nitrososphaerales archaeon]